jgi:hypothetical protein
VLVEVAVATEVMEKKVLIPLHTHWVIYNGIMQQNMNLRLGLRNGSGTGLAHWVRDGA